MIEVEIIYKFTFNDYFPLEIGSLEEVLRSLAFYEVANLFDLKKFFFYPFNLGYFRATLIQHRAIIYYCR